MKNIFFLLFVVLFFVSCSTKQPIKVYSSVVLFKTPKMKFYDMGFVTKYNDHININILNAGKSILKMDIYKNQICRATFECISSKKFNKQYLSDSYNDEFLYNLFKKEKIYFKDKQKHIFIKVTHNI